jgi:hypothetical protein
MKHLVALTLVIAAFAGAGCDSSPNPLIPLRDTIWIKDTLWVIDSTNLRPRDLVGRVTLMTECAVDPNHSGVMVTLETTGQTTVTDDSGYFRFSNVGEIPPNVYPFISFWHQDFSPVSHSSAGKFFFRVDSFHYTADFEMYRFSNYSAKFQSGLKVDSSFYYTNRDTIITNSQGVIVRSRVTDTARVYSYTFDAIALNDNDQPTSLAQVWLLASRTPDFDHLDSKSLVFGVPSNRYPFKLGFSTHTTDLYGLNRGDVIYIAVSSHSECSHEYHTLGARKSSVIPVVIR